MPAPIQDYVKQTCNKKLRYEKTLNSSNKISITFYFYDNQIGLNILMASKIQKVKRFINFSSSCMYPRDTKNPISEDMILKGELNTVVKVQKDSSKVQRKQMNDEVFNKRVY